MVGGRRRSFGGKGRYAVVPVVVDCSANAVGRRVADRKVRKRTNPMRHQRASARESADRLHIAGKMHFDRQGGRFALTEHFREMARQARKGQAAVRAELEALEQRKTGQWAKEPKP